MDYGLPNLFDYRLPSLRERPVSEDMSIMSSNIDDTFSFIHCQLHHRVESDASSFYFIISKLRSQARTTADITAMSPICPSRPKPRLSACTTAALALTGATTPLQVPSRLLFHIIVKKPSITSTSSTDLDASA